MRTSRTTHMAAAGIALMLALTGQATASPAALASTLAKSAQNLTSPGADPANHGDVINWVLSYDSDAPPGPATITDVIEGAPASQEYVPGSLDVPPGWTPQWSTDGTTFVGSEPPTGTVAVRATNPTARPGGTNLTHFLLPPVQTLATPTGGDGFTAVIYRGPGGSVEAWNMYHHLGELQPKVVCTNLLDNQPCSGGPWPRPVNTTPGPLGSGSTGDIESTLVPQYVVDPARPERFYYPAMTVSSVGVACLDMAAQANCGYVPLQAIGGAVTGLEGLVNVGGNMYAVSTNGQILCLTLATLTPCAGQPYAAVAPGSNNGAYYWGSLTVANGLVFVSSSTGAGPRLGCFDPATTAACAGWATARAAAGTHTYSAFTSYNPAGTANGACIAAVSAGPPAVTCYAIDGSPLAAPAGFGNVANGANTFNPTVIVAPNGHLQSYFPFWGGSLLGATGCYDWTAAAICAGFPFPKTHPNVNNGLTRDYGYTYDETTQCLLGLGDSGFLFSVDPANGLSPCLRTGASVTMTPGAFYCDGQPHSVTYTTARLQNINLSNVDLGNSTARVTDPDGNVLATPTFAPDGTLDLSGISAVAEPTIIVTATLVLFNTNDFAGGNQPQLVVEFQGDAPQVCFQTRLGSECTVTSVSNTATGSDPGGDLRSNPVVLSIAPGAACQPRVTVNKEICASNDAEDCGPGGRGPWVKRSPPGLLGILGTAYWRITVSNAGPLDAVDVTVNDARAPSCEAVAGEFLLPSGATREFHCSSFLLVLPITNTASASYLPANSPPGTPRSTSAPSSATACGLILCLLSGPSGQEE
ncbi:DUF7617 domain-containing protein [Allorhizocola rhizosphaerae]|uniref:DUF7617 domain-containing protein n=1 Tax=Allorhizocola rhizosphaerae TaxID=1872709 RepID=UPI001B8CAFD0|nr:hypothetical protein [Allorhizocola rhizosphaerae]